FKNNGFYCVSDVANSHDLYPENPLYPKLLEQGVRSAIIIPMVVHDQMYGLLEIVSTTSRALNSINANKLHDMLPHFSDSVKREKEREENEVELLIQEECTSIHSSVHWKFRREAKRVLKAQKAGAQAFFSEVVFENVHPLFGQMDIKGSSQARNEATVRDLTQQLEHVKQIISQISTIEKLPIYDQLNFRVSEYLEKFNEELQVNSENQVLEFLRTEIVPLFSHLSEKGEGLKTLIKEYYNLIDMTSGLIYKHRKAYDETVMQINKRMAGIIDSKQREAQKMYPHYFERYKTDGVEHSMYVGGSISQSSPFHKIYLHNLRLWQLQVMCEMETHYYKIKEELPLDLEVASMILAFSGTLSLRFRMDEKRFDVDGTYNARYEVVKKRVDKANIKGTDERITQAGKIAVIYSQKEDEDEYLKYIRYLQQKNMLDTDEELLELEDLQGVTGLRAIRVSVLYTKNRDNTKEYYTYEDLIQQISG
ncbi:MAG: GAF domain-containing protein, partial [Marinirhabdus sp.]